MAKEFILDGYQYKVHAIEPSMLNDIMECVQNTKHSGISKESVEAADRVEAYMNAYRTVKREYEEEDEMVTLMEDNDEAMQEACEKQGGFEGIVDDDYEVAFERWSSNLNLKDVKEILDQKSSDQA